MQRRKIIAGIVLILLVTVVAPASQEASLEQKLASLEKIGRKFSFVVLGDNRAGDPTCDAVYAKLIASALERKPDFLINTGDQIDKPGNLTNWKRFKELSRDVSVPYFLTVGNHDVHVEVAGSEEAYMDQADLPGKEIYYSFVAGNSLFLVLDSYIKGEDKRITGEQFAWLQMVLSTSREKHKFVVVHHPLFPEKGKGKHHGNSLDRYPAERDLLHGLFKQYGVEYVFMGHEHLYLRKTIDGIAYIITGGGGAPLYADDRNGGFHHYLLMTVDGDNVTGEVVDVNGKARDRF
ncbi:MAG: metallophosphoesterase [Nitrospiraceae bacterium]|nr:metallophosphoesterase [Nitrospiraceae bacterium]